MAVEYMLTTNDNPYDPFEQFPQWLLFDKEKGYDSCERLMRLANLNPEMSQKEIDDEVDRAMNKLIELDFTNTYKRVKRVTNEPNSEEET